MPTPAQFEGIRFIDTSSYLGGRFQDYLIPNSFEPISSLAGFGGYEDAIDEGRLIPCWTPYPKVSGDRPTAAALEASRQSPLPTRGTYTMGTIVNVFYWVGIKQYRITYQLTPLEDVTAEDIVDYDQLNAFQRLIVETVPRLANLFPDPTDGDSEDAEDDEAKGRFVRRILQWFQDNDLEKALGVWIEVASEVTNIEGISTGFKGFTKSDRVFAGVDVEAGRPKVDFLGLLVSGVGIFTGNPILIGGGLVLSFIQGRQDD